MTEYTDKLKDPRWQKKRLQTLERDNWMCQKCYDTQEMLVIHHRYYIPNTEPWDYPDDVLITLCQPCHEEERLNMPTSEATLMQILCSRYWALDIVTIAEAINKIPIIHTSSCTVSVLEWAFSKPQFYEQLEEQYFEYLSIKAQESCQKAID